jgi:hypothetical protein
MASIQPGALYPVASGYLLGNGLTEIGSCPPDSAYHRGPELTFTCERLLGLGRQKQQELGGVH